jgi:shikimate dehydrogenase
VNKRAAVLGSPIAHSLSPVLHRAAYAALGLDWRYDAVECDEAALPSTLDRLAATHAGLSLTMPLKRAVLGLLDSVDPLARRIGAANTVVFGNRAERRGYNTDVAGAVAALDELGVGMGAAAGEDMVLLGGGGAARAVLAALAQTGWRQVTVVARDPRRAVPLGELGAELGIAVELAPWPEASALVGRAPLVVSSVPAGAADALAEDWPAYAALFDLVYAPWPTPIAAAARDAGAPVVGGLAMLVAQAAEQVRLMTRREPPLAEMRAAGERALRAASTSAVPAGPARKEGRTRM